MQIKLSSLTRVDIEKVLDIVNILVAEGSMPPFAIGGGAASNLWSEPILTEDLDLILVSPVEQGKILTFSSLYTRLVELGANQEGAHYIVEGVKLDLVFVDDELMKEALLNAQGKEVGKYIVPTITPEYLIANYCRIRRGKDLMKIHNLLRDIDVDMEKLIDILQRYNLVDEFKSIEETYRLKGIRGNYGGDNTEVGKRKAKFHKENALKVGQEKLDQLNSCYELAYQYRVIKQANTKSNKMTSRQREEYEYTLEILSHYNPRLVTTVIKEKVEELMKTGGSPEYAFLKITGKYFNEVF